MKILVPLNLDCRHTQNCMLFPQIIQLVKRCSRRMILQKLSVSMCFVMINGIFFPLFLKMLADRCYLIKQFINHL